MPPKKIKMFNKNFYPTPRIGIVALLEGIEARDLAGKVLLEPSAGKGDILDYIETFCGRYLKPKVICMEIEPKLQAILQENYTLIGGDFLSDPVHYDVDYVFMNPPFDQGVKHLLRAWDLVKNGEIRCLLNRTNYDNTNTKERKLLKSIIDEYGQVKNLGSIFSGSERHTNVEVIMVTLKKSTDTGFDFKEEFETEDFIFNENMGASSEIVIRDMLANREARYLASIELYKEFVKAKRKFMSCVSPLVSSYQPSKYVEAEDFYDFVSQFNGDAWDKLLTESKFSDLLTKRVRDEFIYNQFPKQKNIAFSKENMIGLLSILMGNRGEILDRCILDVFDLLTRYYKENRVHIEGWKTNEAYKVGMKFILPNVIKEYDNIFKSYTFEYSNEHKVNDLDLIMCFLTGQKMSSIETVKNVLQKEFDKHRAGEPISTKVESTFFEIKFFKKGTLHFKFKDKLLWQWFNCRASELRGFPLPEAKKVYSKSLVNI